MTDAPNPYANAAPVAENPGKTLGIVALVLAFFFSLVGLILGIIANNQSKAVGMTNGPAKAAIILSIIFMVLGLIIGIAYFAFIAAALNNGTFTTY